MKSFIIADRAYTFHTSISEELQINPAKSYLCELPHLTCLSVIGEKGKDFLQGQLSCDVLEATTESFTKGALCNLQGRIKTLLDVIYCHDYQLVMPLDLLPSIERDLRLPAMLSRVKLHRSQNYQIFGIIGNPDDTLLPEAVRIPAGKSFVLREDFCCYQVSENLWMLLTTNDEAKRLLQNYHEHQQYRGSLLWHYYYLKDGLFSIYPQSSDYFLPHKVSLQKLGFLNFNKGCYKGQEVIARMHYRAKLKHELKFYEIESSETFSIKDKLYASDTHQEVGEIIDFCPLGNQTFLIAASVLIEFSGKPLIFSVRG